VVSIGAWLRTGRLSARAKHLSLLRNVHKVSKAQCIPAALSPEIEWRGHEADQPLPPTTKVKNEWRYASTTPVYLHGMVLTFAFINIINSLSFTLLSEPVDVSLHAYCPTKVSVGTLEVQITRESFYISFCYPSCIAIHNVLQLCEIYSKRNTAFMDICTTDR
jgi:hypothetical protein